MDASNSAWPDADQLGDFARFKAGCDLRVERRYVLADDLNSLSKRRCDGPGMGVRIIEGERRDHRRARLT